MNLTTIRYAAIGTFLLGFAPVGLRAQVQQDHQLVFTEQSPTVLTATLDGSPYGTVVNISGDHWQWTSPTYLFNTTGGVTLVTPGSLLWQEPSGETGVNRGDVTLSILNNVGTVSIDLVSDDEKPFTGTPSDNGTVGGTVTMTQTGNPLFGTADVSFVDQGDSPVPDTSSTLYLTGMAFAGLALLRRHLAPTPRAS